MSDLEMLKFNGKTMKKAVVAEEFAVEDEHFCISSIDRSDSVTAKCGMEVWVFNEADCDSYGSREMCLCWLPKFEFATIVASNLISLIPTESPEEKEALDMIDATSKQVESLANDSELPNSSEWDGEGLPPVGVECCFTPDNNLWGFASTDTYSGEVLRYEGEQFVFLLSHDKYNIRPCHLIVSRTDKGEFSKPESPEQKAERERLEAAYDLCTTVYPDFSGFDEFKKATTTVNLWLAIVDKTGYSKESK
jgi:hypothetical protein